MAAKRNIFSVVTLPKPRQGFKERGQVCGQQRFRAQFINRGKCVPPPTDSLLTPPLVNNFNRGVGVFSKSDLIPHFQVDPPFNELGFKKGGSASHLGLSPSSRFSASALRRPSRLGPSWKARSTLPQWKNPPSGMPARRVPQHALTTSVRGEAFFGVKKRGVGGCVEGLGWRWVGRLCWGWVGGLGRGGWRGCYITVGHCFCILRPIGFANALRTNAPVFEANAVPAPCLAGLKGKPKNPQPNQLSFCPLAQTHPPEATSTNCCRHQTRTKNPQSYLEQLPEHSANSEKRAKNTRRSSQKEMRIPAQHAKGVSRIVVVSHPLRDVNKKSKGW